MEKPKTIDGLMRYLRDKKGVTIRGTSQKRKLRNIGYYHGYKGYRFIKESGNAVPYTDFSQLYAVYQFDTGLKSLMYSHLMFIETALKNYVLEIVLDECKSDNFNTIYNVALTYHKGVPNTSKAYDARYRKRLRVHDKFNKALSLNFGSKKKVVYHFYQKDEYVPIWAIFEVINLGEFGDFVSCLSVNTKKQLAQELKLNIPVNTDGDLVENIIYCIKDLRNAVAHNEIVFDTRFKKGSIRNNIAQGIEFDTGTTGITFQSIVDYIILISYLLKVLCVPKTENQRFIRNFEDLCETFRAQVPVNVYSSIIPTNTRAKLKTLKKYV